MGEEFQVRAHRTAIAPAHVGTINIPNDGCNPWSRRVPLRRQHRDASACIAASFHPHPLPCFPAQCTYLPPVGAPPSDCGAGADLAVLIWAPSPHPLESAMAPPGADTAATRDSDRTARPAATSDAADLHSAYLRRWAAAELQEPALTELWRTGYDAEAAERAMIAHARGVAPRPRTLRQVRPARIGRPDLCMHAKWRALFAR